MSLQILSDLHLETPASYDLFDIPVQAPFLALLGDIGNVKDDGFFGFLKAQLRKFQVVFLLLGNHEPYYSSWSTVRDRVNAFSDIVNHEAHDLGKFVFLDQTRYDLTPEITILGCTLYSHITPAQEDRVSFGLNDFYHIQDWTVEDHNTAHLADAQWLNRQVEILRSTPQRKIVVLTHHSPVLDDHRATDPVHVNSPISSAFATDLSAEECWNSAQVCLWGFGHTHYNCDFVDERTGTRLVANQRGYYFAQAGGFDLAKVIEPSHFA